MADHRGDSYYNNSSDPRSKNDDPPNSRLFVICHKSLEEDDLRKAFDKFGKIEDIWVVKDRNTGENKGMEFSVLIHLSYCLYLHPVVFNFRCHVYQVLENVGRGFRPRGDEREDARLRWKTYQSHDCVQVSSAMCFFGAAVRERGDTFNIADL